jgi:hypothetical protein
VTTIAYGLASTATWEEIRGNVVAWTRTRYAVLALATALALVFRVGSLSTYGLSEDEINKVRAIDEYRAGRFSANAEHPMLMKLAMWASVDSARAWNAHVPPQDAIPFETALRLPTAIAGAAATPALFGVADLLFGGAAASAVAFIWAFDVNAIAINRIGKEDTFLLLFFLVAVFCYERAKQRWTSDRHGAQRWYMLSGAFFGLMLASKYMPHLLGFYALFNFLLPAAPALNKPDKVRHYAAMAAAFVAANVAIVMPSTWRYAAAYVGGGMLAHHGYPYAGGLYLTNVPISPLGVPATYYLRFIATKVPLVLLAAVVPGLIEMARRHRERGFVLLRVLIVFLLVPYSLFAAKFIRYTLPMLATLDLIGAVGLVSAIGWLLRKSWLSQLTRVTVSAIAIGVFVGGIVRAQEIAAPFYSLYQNAAGARLDAPGSVFPEEVYDYGVREAVAAIASRAVPGAAIVSDATSGVGYYLQSTGRSDMSVVALSGQGIPAHAAETWVIVQNEHLTFENQSIVNQLRAREHPWAQYGIGGALAAQVFHLPGN